MVTLEAAAAARGWDHDTVHPAWVDDQVSTETDGITLAVWFRDGRYEWTVIDGEHPIAHGVSRNADLALDTATSVAANHRDRLF